MNAVTEEQAVALLDLLLQVYARQMAVLKLIRTLSGISEIEIDQALGDSLAHLNRIPGVEDALSKKNLAEIQTLVKTLESAPVDQW